MDCHIVSILPCSFLSLSSLIHKSLNLSRTSPLRVICVPTLKVRTEKAPSPSMSFSTKQIWYFIAEKLRASSWVIIHCALGGCINLAWINGGNGPRTPNDDSEGLGKILSR